VTKIYVVVGSAGEYSDHNYWFVKAFASREKAEALEHLLVEQAKAIYAIHDADPQAWLELKWEEEGDYVEVPKRYLRDDPQLMIRYTGTDYATIELDFDAS